VAAACDGGEDDGGGFLCCPFLTLGRCMAGLSLMLSRDGDACILLSTTLGVGLEQVQE